jgi:hypothetical protein
LKIIDWERKGNVVRFYLGNDELKEWWGDDWDDAPYEHNAGSVYHNFVEEHKDIAVPFDDEVIEPSDGFNNSPYSKDDMMKRKIPCIIVVPREVAEELYKTSFCVTFEEALRSKGAKMYYMGDTI